MGQAGQTASFLQGLYQGLDKAADRRSKQEALTRQREEYEFQKSLRPMQQEQAQMQLEQTQLQLKQLRQEINKKEMFDIFDNNSLYSLNDKLSSDKTLQKTFGGAVKLERLSSFNGPEEVALRRQAKGIKEPMVALMPDGTRKVVDLEKYKQMSGYSAYKEKKDLAKKQSDYEMKNLEYKISQIGAQKPTNVQPSTMEKNYNFITKTRGKEAADQWLGGQMGQGTGELDLTKINTQTEAEVAAGQLKMKQQKLAKEGKDLSDDEKFQLKVLDEAGKSDSDKKRDAIIKGGELTSKYAKGLDGDISQTDVDSMQLAASMASKKFSDKIPNELADDYVVLNAGKDLATNINALKPEEINKGIIDVTKQSAISMLSDDTFDGLSEAEKKKTLLSVMANTQLGDFLAKYIKSISGTAVAEAEYKRLAQVLKGGNDFANTEVLKTGLNTFLKNLASGFETKMQASYYSNPPSIVYQAKLYNDSGLRDYFKQNKERVPTPEALQGNATLEGMDAFMSGVK